MEKDNLVYELMDAMMELKKVNSHSICIDDNLSPNERMILFIIKNIGDDDGILLSKVRSKIKLAPSTITPIVTSLEKKGLVERKIDTNDRRNIYVCLSSKGKIFTKEIDNKLKNVLIEYINYMGEKDVIEIIKLINKTKEYMKFRKGEIREC